MPISDETCRAIFDELPLREPHWACPARGRRVAAFPWDGADTETVIALLKTESR